MASPQHNCVLPKLGIPLRSPPFLVRPAQQPSGSGSPCPTDAPTVHSARTWAGPPSSSCQASSPPQATSRTASFLLTSLLQVFTGQSSFFFFSCHFVPVSLNLCPFPQETRILSVKGKNKKNTHTKKQAFHQTFESTISVHCVSFSITLISCKWLLLLLYCHCSLQGWPLHRDIQRPWLSLHFSLLSFDPLWGFPAGSVVKNLPANAGDAGSVPGLGRSPEEEMATHSCILAGKSQGQRNLEGHSPWGHRESDVTEQLRRDTSFHPLHPYP